MKMVLETLNQWQVIKGDLMGPIRKNLESPTDEELMREEAWVLRRKRAYSEILL